MLFENVNVELKQEYVDDIKKTVIAFANTDGGKIYVGIADGGSVVGIKDPDEIMLKLTNSIRDSIKPDVTLFTSYKIEKVEGADVVVVEVQLGTARPYYLSGKGIRPEGVFVRQGASTVPATGTAILNMIRETSGDSYEDTRCINHVLTFDALKKEFNNRKIALNDSQMKTLKLVRSDGEYTNLALLLSDQCLHTLKVAIFQGIDKSIFRDRAEFSGSILMQLNDSYEYIDRFNNTRAEFSGLQRIDKRDYPIDAIREALLNSLIHHDYAFSAPTLINIYDDRMELVSVGGLVRGISYDDMMLGVSILRNQNLAGVFYRLNLIEAYGTGIPKISASYKSYAEQPKIEVSDNAFKITLPNTNYKHSNIVSNELNESEKKVAALFENKNVINRKDVETSLKISQTTAISLLRKMTTKGILVKEGSGKNTCYVLSKAILID